MNNKVDKKEQSRPIILFVLDGWGILQPYSGNAISQANTANMEGFISRYPSTTLRASGEAVGLPWGESGNSEVGHLNLGLGRIVYQGLPRINKAISDNSFFKNEALLKAIAHVKKNKSQLHLLGLVSNGGVHSSIEHLEALLVLAKEHKIKKVFIHAILDGRDTPYNNGLNFIKDIERFFQEYGLGKIATICGRFYAMDRDNHWTDRVAKAFAAICYGEGKESQDAVSAVESSYNNKIYDEEFSPTVIKEEGKPVAIVEDKDAMVFFNFRADRARQLTKAFVIPSFNKFPRREYFSDLLFVSFTQYEKFLPVEVAFPPEAPKNGLGEVIASAKLKQLRIAETEKYAHVTYFFNGGRDVKFPGEDRLLVPSPRIASYDLKPEMSIAQVTDKLVKAINDETYDFIMVNFANPDMVGHTGNLKAAVKSVEAVDKALGRIVKRVLLKGGVAVITADHGNCEMMFNMQTGAIDKEHSSNPVPLVIVGKQFEGRNIKDQDAPGNDLSLVKPQGVLADVAPTILKIMQLKQPPEMTGRPLI